MDFSIYRVVGQSTERSVIKKPRKPSYHCQHKWTYRDYPECPKWHQTALRLMGIVLVILVATVIVLIIWENLCPNDWLHKKGKCYKFFMNFKSWIDSQKLCSLKKSHLLVIEDKAELEFIQSNIQVGNHFWIGLNITHPQKAWTWLDGTPLNLQLFQVTGQIKENVCALITNNGVFSESCLMESFWICQEVISSSIENKLN
ncbi:killer cell lectin-like receptor subfamily F member 1 isoform X1 [Sciurus carolinensis]|uniref:killer cell lectin-like receptor subfamily F member 1 isoform X1 n=1 Tax=Sciurus carolinensis TaxID=30640 RepID=UPI001FB2AFA1|nr:killer cell lectin-like receptor subfamily F member 1 isoform X1 [Sciurus carolinensis]